MIISMINPLSVFEYGLPGVFLFIDGVVYWAVSKIFGVFETLARVEFLTEGTYREIVNKFLVIIGVFMLFYLSYSFLKSLINPDDFSKNTSKIVTNLVISLVLLGVLPVIFTQAFRLQRLIIDNHILDKIILNQDTENNDPNYITKHGNRAALNTLNAFLNPNNANIEGESTQKWNDFKKDLVVGNASFMDITDFAEKIHEQDAAPDSDGNIVLATYTPIVSTLCGMFLCYVLVSFSLDLGVRVVKLAFYQILAPIPIIMRIIPEKKSVFDNWVKGSLATYLEVYVRIFIMLIVVFFASLIFAQNDSTQLSNVTTNQNYLNQYQVKNQELAVQLSNLNNIEDKTNTNSLEIKYENKEDLQKENVQKLANESEESNPNDFSSLGMLGKVIVVMGLFAAAKQAPEMISDITGIDSGNIKLGIGGRLAAGGAFGLAAMAGGAATTGIRNFTHGYNNFKEASGFKNKLLAVGSGLLSTAAGTVSGGARNIQGGFKAKNFKEMRDATSKGIQEATKARDKRENYRASHGGYIGALTGHVEDFGHSALNFLGIGSSLEGLKQESERVGAVSSSRKALEEAAKAEVLKESNMLKYKLTSAINGFDNLATLDNLIETIKSTGVDDHGNSDAATVAERITELRNTRQEIEKKMVQQYINGVNLDATDPTTHGDVNRSYISGPVQEAIAKHNTELKNNLDAILRNLTAEDLANSDVQTWKTDIESYINNIRNMDPTAVMGNTAYDIGKIAEEVKKFAGTAQTNVNTRVNEYRQEEARRNGNNNS